jgi:hypothetical protein
MTTTTYTKYFETRTASAVVGENFGWLKSIAYFLAVVLPKVSHEIYISTASGATCAPRAGVLLGKK